MSSSKLAYLSRYLGDGEKLPPGSSSAASTAPSSKRNDKKTKNKKSKKGKSKSRSDSKIHKKTSNVMLVDADDDDDIPATTALMNSAMNPTREPTNNNTKPNKKYQPITNVNAAHTRNGNDSDTAPPRKQRFDSEDEGDSSPAPTRVRYDSDDGSVDNEANEAPARRSRFDSDDYDGRDKKIDRGDSSPPRGPQRDSLDVSNDVRNDFGNTVDSSPPRRPQLDASNDVENGKNTDSSPPRQAPPASVEDNDGDLLPPRRRQRADSSDDEAGKDGLIKKNVDVEEGGINSKSKSKRMRFSGTTAGLKSGDQFAAEMNEAKARKALQMSSADETQMGKGSATVYRDKTGKKVDVVKQLAEKSRKEAEDKAKEEKRMKQWRAGKADREAGLSRAQAIMDVASKPFSRSADDIDMNDALKAELRSGDPMAMYMQQKADELEEREREKEAKTATSEGEDAPVIRKRKQVYKGSFLPNRFGVKPGYRWDGVDRSNGFEKQAMLSGNKRAADAETAYKWSVSDM